MVLLCVVCFKNCVEIQKCLLPCSLPNHWALSSGQPYYISKSIPRTSLVSPVYSFLFSHSLLLPVALFFSQYYMFSIIGLSVSQRWRPGRCIKRSANLNNSEPRRKVREQRARDTFIGAQGPSHGCSEICQCLPSGVLRGLRVHNVQQGVQGVDNRPPYADSISCHSQDCNSCTSPKRKATALIHPLITGKGGVNSISGYLIILHCLLYIKLEFMVYRTQLESKSQSCRFPTCVIDGM